MWLIIIQANQTAASDSAFDMISDYITSDGWLERKGKWIQKSCNDTSGFICHQNISKFYFPFSFNVSFFFAPLLLLLLLFILFLYILVDYKQILCVISQ